MPPFLSRRRLSAAILLALALAGTAQATGEAQPGTESEASGAGRETASLQPIVVTAVMDESPLTSTTDPRKPRQPVSASDGADFLKSIPGFSTIRKGGSNGDPVLRGMAGSRLNIRIDGGEIGGGCPSRMDPPTAYIAPELFDRVTVIKGPQTVLHGPGNSAGTVLFEREHRRYAAPDVFLGASVLGGLWGRNDQSVDVRAGNPDVQAALVGHHAHAQDYEDGNGDRVHSSYDRWNTDASLAWTPDDDTRLALDAGKGDGRAAYAFSLMDGAKFRRESVALSLDHARPGAAFARIEAKLYYHYADHVMDNYTLRDPDPASMMPMPMASEVDRRTLGGRVAATFERGAWTVVTGVDASGNVHSGRNGGPPGGMMGDYRDRPRVRDARLSSAGAFAESNWTLSAQQRLVAGLRIDRAQARGYTLAEDAPAPMDGMDGHAMGGGMHDPHPVTTVAASRDATLPSGFVRWEHTLDDAPATLYAGIGHVRRFPDYWELFGQHVAGTLPAFLDLRPERTTQLDVGLQYRGERVKAWLSAYAGVVDDFIVLHYPAERMGDSFASNVDARIAGGEAGIAWTATERWKLDATLAYAWGENRSEHRPLPQMPPLEARFGATWDNGTWSLGALWRVATAQHRIAVGEGNIVGQDLGRTGGFGVFSINGGYRLSRQLTLSAGLDNVFDKPYAEHVNAANPGLAGYVNTLRVNEPGRTGWVKLGLSF